MRIALPPALARMAARLRDDALGVHCALCGVPGVDPCADCRQALAAREALRTRCRRCAEPVPGGNRNAPLQLCARCSHDAPAFDRAVCATDYAAPLDRIELALKFARRADLASPLAMLLIGAVQRSDDLGPIDRIIPIPLAAQRLAERGYNQAALIAAHLAHALRVPLDLDSLRRIRATAPIAGLDRDGRARAMRNAFGACARLDGQVLALVDDVMTTGVTMHEAAHALKAVGAVRVIAMAPLRTPPEPA